MAKAATHYGTCQACGNRQKLPGGRLAQHGYTVDHGFFNGVCFGSGHLPLEQSCDLIASTIEGARKEIAKCKARVERLRAPATEPKGWTTETFYSGRRQIRLPVEVEIKTDDKGRAYYETKDRYSGRARRTYGFQLGGYYGKTDLDLANYLNGLHAGEIERKIPQITAYIAHQEEVVRQWKPTDLVPIKK